MTARLASYDGAQEFVREPIKRPDGTEFPNFIHTVIDGFCVDWVVLNYDNRSVKWARKSPTSRERQREHDASRRRMVNIPDGTWDTLKGMALQELDKEVTRWETTPKKVAPRNDRQLSLL